MRSAKFGVAALVVVLVSLAFGAAAGSASGGVSVLICATAPSYDADVQAKLVGTGRFSSVDTFDCSSGTPTPSQLASYSAVLVYSDGAYSDSTGLGNELADYADAGGQVVEAAFNFFANPSLALQGRWASDGYSAYSFGGGPATPGALNLVADLPSNPLLNGVSSFNGGSSNYMEGVTLAPGSTQVAHWDDGSSTPLVAYNAHSVGLNFYPPSSDIRADFWDASTDGAALLANALLFRLSASNSNGPRIAVCTTTPVYRSGDGSWGSFADVDLSFWNAKKLDSSSPYFGATPAIYVQGFGLMCQPSDVATYGGDPAKLTRASYLVTELGGQAPAGVDGTAAGAFYAYYTSG
jgi:hypothetical protein